MDSSPLHCLPDFFSPSPRAPLVWHQATRRAFHGRPAFPAPPWAERRDNVARPNRINPQTTSRFTPGRSIRGAPDAVGALSMHSAESWHGSGRQITCHPLALLPLRLSLHAPLPSPVLSVFTGTWKRTRVAGSCIGPLALWIRRSGRESYLGKSSGSNAGSLPIVIAAKERTNESLALQDRLDCRHQLLGSTGLDYVTVARAHRFLCDIRGTIFCEEENPRLRSTFADPQCCFDSVEFWKTDVEQD